MRLPFKGLACVFIAAGCSTNKPPETVDSTTVAASDTTVTSEPREWSEPAPASPEESSSNNMDTTETTTAPSTIGDPPEATPETDTTGTEVNTAPAAPVGTKPDNTKVNKRDADSAALTPFDQGENESDLKVTQQIRQAVMADGSLSFTAKNVKIITLNGKVTLRGPVKTAAERTSIEGAARKVAGAGKVDNQLEVAP